MENEDIDCQVEAMRRLLARLIRVRGVRLGDLDRRFGYRRGYVSRLLRGSTRLSCIHVLAILDALEVTPAFFYSTLYPGPEDGRRAADPRLAAVRAMLERMVRRLEPAGAAEPVASPPAAEEELAVRIERAAWRMAAMDRPQERPREESEESPREGEEEPEPGRER